MSKQPKRNRWAALAGWLILPAIVACAGYLVLLLTPVESRRGFGALYGVGFCWLAFALAGGFVGLVARKGGRRQAKSAGLVRVFALALVLAIPLLALLYALRAHLQ